MRCITIGENEANQRLDKLLAKYLRSAPKSFLYKMLRKKNIVLNGRKAAGNEILKAQDEIKLFLSEETIRKFTGPALETPKVDQEIPLVYEDSHVLIFNKPVGVLSQKADVGDISLNEYLISYLGKTGQLSEEFLRSFRPSVCNRLDRNTGGLVAAGKSLVALQELSALFRQQRIGKYYLCLVAGDFRAAAMAHGIWQEEGCIGEGYLMKDETCNKVRVSDSLIPGGVPIKAVYSPLAYSPDYSIPDHTSRRGSPKTQNKMTSECSDSLRVYSGGFTLLEVKLLTGKSHQIRAHLSYLGCPVAGDTKYGHREANRQVRGRWGLSSQFLHAYKMVFPQMEGALAGLSGRTVTAPLGTGFQEIVKELGLHGYVEFQGASGLDP